MRTQRQNKMQWAYVTAEKRIIVDAFGGIKWHRVVYMELVCCNLRDGTGENEEAHENILVWKNVLNAMWLECSTVTN